MILIGVDMILMVFYIADSLSNVLVQPTANCIPGHESWRVKATKRICLECLQKSAKRGKKLFCAGKNDLHESLGGFRFGSYVYCL